MSAHTNAEFRKIWSSFEAPMTQFKLDVIGEKRKEFCYAGSWSLFVNMYTGESQPCYWQPYNQNIFKDPLKPIKFVPVGHTCTQPYCTNAHAHLCWGIIPELKSPKYSEMRNRVMSNGDEWLTQECKTFFESKLYESNKPYTKEQQMVHTIIYPCRLVKWFLRDWKNNLRRINNYLKRIGK